MAKTGRPDKPIDWEKAKDLAMAGSKGPEIASHFNIHYNTFYDRCQKDLGLTYTEFCDIYREKGNSLIRAHQFAKALGHTDKGDNTLLIWLGKQRLEQREKNDISASIVVNTINYADADDKSKDVDSSL